MEPKASIQSMGKYTNPAQQAGILATVMLEGQYLSTGRFYLENEYGAAQFEPESESTMEMCPPQGAFLRLFDNGGPLIRVKNLRPSSDARSKHYRLDFEVLSGPGKGA